MNAMEEQGFHWSCTIIWKKDTFVVSRRDYHPHYEPIWYGWEGSVPRVCPMKDRAQSDVWEIARPNISKEHPMMKPIELVARAVKNSSHAGANVLDVFGGAGSTLIACEQTKRVCYTCELAPQYADVIVQRWQNLSGENAILEATGENYNSLRIESEKDQT
jgi:DNA modification methylase